jgi:tRNA threonylcarbamoyladenosine modification (KEOPS) complex  Pcc1 subunit
LPPESLSTSSKAEILIDIRGNLADILEDSLLPEVERPSSERSKVYVEAVDGRLVIRVESSDVVALRAALNSYLYWVSAVLDVVDKIR